MAKGPGPTSQVSPPEVHGDPEFPVLIQQEGQEPSPRLGGERWGRATRLKRHEANTYTFNAPHSKVGSKEAASSLGCRVTNDSVNKAKETQQVTTEERVVMKVGGGGCHQTHTQVHLPGGPRMVAHWHTCTRCHSAGPKHVSGAISLRKQKRLSILFLNHIFQDQNLISQALLLKAKTNNTSILPASQLQIRSLAARAGAWAEGPLPILVPEVTRQGQEQALRFSRTAPRSQARDGVSKKT